MTAYSEEEALDMHPAFLDVARPTSNHEDYMYSKNPDIFPDCFDMEWVKNPKEDAYVRLLGYVAEDALENIKNQDVIAIDSPAFL